MAIEIQNVEKLLAELRKQPDLELFQRTQGEAFCRKNHISGGNLNFLLAVVANERFREANKKAKQDIINKRKL